MDRNDDVITDENVLTSNVCDDALERAARPADGQAWTLNYCTYNYISVDLSAKSRSCALPRTSGPCMCGEAELLKRRWNNARQADANATRLL